jgi:hypothetical protein
MDGPGWSVGQSVNQVNESGWSVGQSVSQLNEAGMVGGTNCRPLVLRKAAYTICHHRPLDLLLALFH